MKSVDKTIFPILLKQLMETDISNYLVKVFCVSGLWPLNEDPTPSKLTNGTGKNDKDNDLNFVEL